MMENKSTITLSVMEKLKHVIREQNRVGKLLWLRFLWCCVRDLWMFYPLRRFSNLLYYIYLVVARRYQPLKLDSGIRNGVFYICLVENGEETLLLKIPHLNSEYSYALCKKLRDSKAFNDYSCMLKSLSDNTILGKYIPRVKKVRRDGGYWTSYIEGYNLFTIRDMLLNNRSLPVELKSAGLVYAIDELLQTLHTYKNHHGHIIGDWGIGNLVYDKLVHRIINVDLEGFYIYGKDRLETNIAYIEAVLSSLKEILRIQESQVQEDLAVLKVLSLVNFAAKSNVSYSGHNFPSGYHSLTLRHRYFRGQRECATRLTTVPYDFTNKVVLDLGCNCGGVLHYLADRILMGVGLDMNPKLINAANAIKSLNGTNNLHFFMFDLDENDMSMIGNFMLNKRVDICFLLSICMWLKNWKKVVAKSSKISNTLLFESNGDNQQQMEQAEFLYKQFSSVELINSESSDDFKQSKRILYLCKNVPILQKDYP